MANLEQVRYATQLLDNGSRPEYDLPSGFHLQHEAVSNEAWEAIQHWLFSNMLPSSANNESSKLIHLPIHWETGEQMQGRQVAQFGSCKYDYIADEAVLCEQIIPIPTYIRQTLLSNEDSEQYTQCIINVYEAQHKIPWHVDHEYFGDKVLVYTFGEERPLLLRKPVSIKDESLVNGSIGLKEPEEGYAFHTAYPRHSSKYVLQGVARNEWEHSVPSGNGKRVSITFRSWRGAK
jgi:alkylated DNA repair dioxygenase AlkB